MSILINNRVIGASVLIDEPEYEIQEIAFTATDLNEATNVLSASLDESVTLQNNTVYLFAVDCDDLAPGVSTKIHLTDFNETIESAYGYYNPLTNFYKFYVLHENNANKPTADVSTVIRVSGKGGGEVVTEELTATENDVYYPSEDHISRK